MRAKSGIGSARAFCSVIPKMYYRDIGARESAAAARAQTHKIRRHTTLFRRSSAAALASDTVTSCTFLLIDKLPTCYRITGSNSLTCNCRKLCACGEKESENGGNGKCSCLHRSAP